MSKNNIIISNKLVENINFAKSHGIYGFAFYYSLNNDKKNSNSICVFINEFIKSFIYL